MPVLRLPAVIPTGFVASACRYHRPCFLLLRISCQPLAGLALGRPGVLGLSPDGSPVPEFYCDGTTRASQVPGESSRAFAPLMRPRPRRHVLPLATLRCCPR